MIQATEKPDTDTQEPAELNEEEKATDEGYEEEVAEAEDKDEQLEQVTDKEAESVEEEGVILSQVSDVFSQVSLEDSQESYAASPAQKRIKLDPEEGRRKRIKNTICVISQRSFARN